MVVFQSATLRGQLPCSRNTSNDNSTYQYICCRTLRAVLQDVAVTLPSTYMLCWMQRSYCEFSFFPALKEKLFL
jgi:hypothetical protein